MPTPVLSLELQVINLASKKGVRVCNLCRKLGKDLLKNKSDINFKILIDAVNIVKSSINSDDIADGVYGNYDH